jgi:hypothetical protein
MFDGYDVAECIGCGHRFFPDTGEPARDIKFAYDDETCRQAQTYGLPRSVLKK